VLTHQTNKTRVTPANHKVGLTQTPLINSQREQEKHNKKRECNLLQMDLIHNPNNQMENSLKIATPHQAVPRLQ